MYQRIFWFHGIRTIVIMFGCWNPRQTGRQQSNEALMEVCAIVGYINSHLSEYFSKLLSSSERYNFTIGNATERDLEVCKKNNS